MADLLIGTGISTSAAAGADPVAEARAAEAAGYDFVSASDHPVGDHPTYELTTLLTWVAAHTERIGVATRVLGVPFRRPAMVAKTAESLQRFSQGRLILGLGGGALDDEIVALGGPRVTPGRKVAGMADAIEIMRRAWDGGQVAYDGTEHSVAGLVLNPSPVAPVPIWLGTYGPKALAVTGRLADGWIPSLGAADARDLPLMLERIRDAATDAGRDPRAVRAVLNVTLRLGAGERCDDHTLGGSPEDVLEQLRGYVDRGFRGFNLIAVDGQAPAVAQEILPALQALSVPSNDEH